MIHSRGPLLTIDVSKKQSSTEDIDGILSQYIGGRGVATRLAHERIPFDADPFGESNRIYFSVGPLQQSQMSFTGRMNGTSLSPLTDGLVSSNAGGYLSRNFVDTGYPIVEIVGKSDDLLAIHVTDEGVTFESVPELEQATVPQVTSYIENEHDLEAEHILCIGPAGENLVRYASVMTYESRAFGRGGLGAVLGAKGVKAITFSGDSSPPMDLPADLQRDVNSQVASSDDMRKRQGTTRNTKLINDEFSIPTRYFSEYSFEEIENIDGDAVESKKYKKAACSVCALACKLPTKDEASNLETEGPEFETLYSFGTNQGVGDIVDVMKSNELCDIYGLDTISCGVSIAAYMAENDEFGNGDLAQELVEKIAYREDEGDLLAEGVDRFHSEMNVENFSVKGLEFAAHDGRTLHGQGFSYAVANRGADHMYSTMLRVEYNGIMDRNGLEGKPAVVRERENQAAIRDSAVICAFGEGEYVTKEVLESILDVEYEKLLTIGDNVVEMERHFNNQRGMDRDNDRLPYELPDFDAALDEYYAVRGWNEDGTVPEQNVAGYLEYTGSSSAN